VGSNEVVVGYVDLHYVLASVPTALKNFRMSNDSATHYFFELPQTLSSTEKVDFNFTYWSLVSNSAESTYTYHYDVSAKTITQLTVVITPELGTIDQSATLSGTQLTYRAAVQRYSNWAEHYTVEFISFNPAVISGNSDLVILHYIINHNGVDGALTSHTMNQNPIVNGSQVYDWTIPLASNAADTPIASGDLLKFNFTYWNSALNAGQGAAASTPNLQWSPNDNVINNLGDPINQPTGSNGSTGNGNSNSNGSTGNNGQSVSSTGVSGNNNSTGSTGVNSNNNGNGNGQQNGAAGQTASAAVGLFSVAAALLLM